MPNRLLKMMLVGAFLGVFAVAALATDWGTVKVDSKDTAIEITLDEGKTTIVITPKGTKFPVGTYEPLTWRYMKKDKAGKTWYIAGSPQTITVEKDQTVVIEDIPKITVTGMLTSREVDEKTGEVYYTVFPHFQAGDKSVAPYAERNNSPQSPLYRIEDEKERVFKEGKFGFG